MGRKSRTPGSAYRRGTGSFRCKYAVFVVCCKCRFGGKGVDCIIGGLAPSGCAPEGDEKFFASPDAKAERGGCLMTFEQVVLLLTLLGGAIYITFEIAWTISNGKKK